MTEKEDFAGTTRVASEMDSDPLLDPEVKLLAENTDLSPRQAKQLVEQHGRDRDKLLQLAKTMKAES